MDSSRLGPPSCKHSILASRQLTTMIPEVLYLNLLKQAPSTNICMTSNAWPTELSGFPRRVYSAVLFPASRRSYVGKFKLSSPSLSLRPSPSPSCRKINLTTGAVPSAPVHRPRPLNLSRPSPPPHNHPTPLPSFPCYPPLNRNLPLPPATTYAASPQRRLPASASLDYATTAMRNGSPHINARPVSSS